MMKAMGEILVSVIVPSYKRHRDLVERAIGSLLEQTYQNIEIVLIDDNARDDLQSYRKELETMVAELHDDRICYIQNKENLGGAGARNAGLQQAKGEYITFLDDDDVYLPEKIEKQLAFMLENKLDVSFTKLNIYNENDVLIDVRSHDGIESFELEYLRRYHLTKQITGTPTFMMKKEVLVAVGGFEVVPVGQEFYLMQKVLQKDFVLGYYPECDVKAYRTEAETISNGKNKVAGQLALYSYKKQFFSMLSLSEKQYIRCRHYAVMAVSYKRDKQHLKALMQLFISVMCSPLLAVKEALALQKRKSATNITNKQETVKL